MGWTVLAGVVFVALGVFLFVRPDLLWNWTERWKSTQAEAPSDFYVKSTKFGGVVFALLGVAISVLPFVVK